MATRTEDGWVVDDKDNRASIERWGSEEAAIAELAGTSQLFTYR